jgi:hypothetical protein
MRVMIHTFMCVMIHGDDMSTMCPIGLLMLIIVLLIYVIDVSTTLTIYHDV